MGISKFYKTFKNDKETRTKWITYTTMTYNFVWSILKITFGIFMRSFLYCISGAYTLLMGFVKKIFLSNRNTVKNIKIETKSLIMGVLLTICGLAFGLYMGRLFFWPQEFHYGLIWSIAIAVCSFIELGLAIFNVRKARKKEDILLFSLRCCNLSASFFAIVLTQTALLSATATKDVSIYNAITGVIAGLLVVIIGVIVIYKSAILAKKNKTNLEEQKM